MTGPAGTPVQGLVQGVTWAGTAYMATSVIGGMLGVDDEPWFKSAQNALSAGLFAGKTAQGIVY